MKKVIKKLNQREKRALDIFRAMSEIKRVVARHGLDIVNAGVKRLVDKRSKLRRAEELRKEAAELEK